MKDIKALLKEARDAIKNKDFETSLQLAKTILKEDKTNYMALIFLGLSLQEVGPKDQAPKAFLKAIEQNESNPLGWNGLINYYEKINDNANKTELVKAYIGALKYEPSQKKLVEYCQKLSNLYQCGDLNEICNSVYDLVKTGKFDGDSKLEVLKILVNILANAKDIPETLHDLYENSLLELLDNPTTKTARYYSDYLTFLHKRRRKEDVLKHAKNMHELYENDVTSLTWICKLFNEAYVEKNEQIVENIQEYCSKILSVDQRNAMALFTQSILYFEQNKLLEVKENLLAVTSQRPGLIHAWLFLTEVHLKLNLYHEALRSADWTERLLKSVKSPNVLVTNKLTSLKIQIWAKSDDAADWNSALDLFRQIKDETTKHKCLAAVIKINLNLRNNSAAELLISDLCKSDQTLANLFTAQVLREQKKYREALDVLKQNPIDSFDFCIELGLLHLELGEYRECLMAFLKAGKLDRNNYLCFLYLGDCYSKIGDDDKARKCYERAFQLNPKSFRAASELSDIYLKQKKIDANLALLRSLTSDPINKTNLWAYLKLGLTYFEEEDYLKATENLQLVIRIDPQNVHCWEALADAYFSRGAYTSALKCYEEASKLSDNALYPSLQVAYIKKILGEYAEAKKDFEEILYKNGQYVPALKGLAETCMNLARTCLREQRLGTARDHAQSALDNLARSLQKTNEFPCLWKLLGDCCVLVAKLPEKFSCLLVPKYLVQGKNIEGDDILEREELYELAAKCFSKAISLTADNTWLFRDLASCYLHHALNTERDDKKRQLFEYALLVAHHCVDANPSEWQHWNLLGCAYATKTVPNYGLAQHAFIKAVTVDHNCAVAWANLGVIYLINDMPDLANKAFSQGQSRDPNYVNSWIGQAIVAETFVKQSCQSEALDLFRHSTQLAHHQQGALGYGHWVCKALLDPKVKLWYPVNMHTVPGACDSLTWYTEKNPYDSCAWNMLGILKERMGLIQGATQAFKTAYRLAPKEHKDKARINYGRLLAKSGNYPEAIKLFMEVEEVSFNSATGLALALFKDKQYENSYNVYEQALNWLADDESRQSELLVGLAGIAYMFQGAKAAKTLLFQSIALKPPSPSGLYATLALASLHKDQKLAQLVLKELDALKDQKDCFQHYAVLISCLYLLKGEHDRAIKEVSKVVHSHPSDSSVWLSLAIVLLRSRKKRQITSSVAKCAEAAMRLREAESDVRKVLSVVSLASFIAGDEKKAFIAAQKAVHCYPDAAEEWAVLSYVISNRKKKSTGDSFARKMLSHLESFPESSKLIKWLKKL